MSSKAFIILGNQLFPTVHLKDYKDHIFFMAEDYGLCTYVKHHKQKILLFLSAMRSYAEELQTAKLKVTYYNCEHKLFTKDYEAKLLDFIQANKITEITSFEIEDKFFETRVINFLVKHKINYHIVPSPMFVTSRAEFAEYLQANKKPFMATFYKLQRIKLNILIKDKNKPIGDKWSFDEDNRKKLAHNIDIPKLKVFKHTSHTKELIPFIEKHFASHPGNLKAFHHPTTRKDTIKLFLDFLNNKIKLFGDYEDSITTKSYSVFHSMLSPVMNLGLITPGNMIKETLLFAKKIKYHLIL